MKSRLKSSSHKLSPHFIPRQVLMQLIAHLDSFPAHYRRMVMLLVLSGIRVSKLCSLPFDCLVRGPGGIWFLRYDTVETPVKLTIPLSPSAVAVIQEQQQALKQEPQRTANLLFLNTKGMAISPKTFMAQLNRLAAERDIRDAAGEVWRFQAHQIFSPQP